MLLLYKQFLFLIVLLIIHSSNLIKNILVSRLIYHHLLLFIQRARGRSPKRQGRSPQLDATSAGRRHRAFILFILVHLFCIFVPEINKMFCNVPEMFHCFFNKRGRRPPAEGWSCTNGSLCQLCHTSYK